MKVRVNKKWWQFWLPSHIYLDWESVEWAAFYKDMNQEMLKHFDNGSVVLQTTPKGGNTFHDLANTPAAIEADEDIPWYGQEDEESSVVTAEPPIVSASRGNAKVAERKERAKMQ
jgi:hypothetical protein